MNERILELAEQAKEHANSYDDAGTPIWFQFYNEKFAELIVEECAGLFPAEYDTVEGKITIGKIIKAHFGVDE